MRNELQSTATSEFNSSRLLITNYFVFLFSVDFEQVGVSQRKTMRAKSIECESKLQIALVFISVLFCFGGKMQVLPLALGLAQKSAQTL